MTDPASIERTLGNHDARLAMMEGRMASIETRLDARFDSYEAKTAAKYDLLQEAIASLSASVTSARGFWNAWKVVGYVIVGSGAVGSAVATVIHYGVHGF